MARVNRRASRILAKISALAEVLVVDGSSLREFKRHAEQFGATVHHLRPDRDLSYAMGKVKRVITGVRRASNEAIVIADEDVRYEPEPCTKWSSDWSRGARRATELLSAAPVARAMGHRSHAPQPDLHGGSVVSGRRLSRDTRSAQNVLPRDRRL